MSGKTQELLIGMELKKRTDIHYARKIWHMGGVSMMALFFALTPTKWSILVMAVAWVLFVPIDFIRQKFPAFNDTMVHMFRPIMRDSELHRLAGTTYLLSGVGLVLLVFPRDIILLTLLFLAFADPLASYFGIRYGKDKIFGHKSLQGSMAAFTVCTLITFFFLFSKAISFDRHIVVALLGGLIGAVAELVPIGTMDDNFTLPVVSATFLYLLFALFGVLL